MSLEDELRFALDWVQGIETPPMPIPSAWTDVLWCQYWRERQGRALRAIEQAWIAERIKAAHGQDMKEQG